MLKKIYYYPPYTILYLPIFFKYNGISLLASEHHNPSKQKKSLQYNIRTCVLYILTCTSTRKSERGSRHDIKILGVFRKKEKKKKRNFPPPPSPYLRPPTLDSKFRQVRRNRPIFCRKEIRKGFFFIFTPQKNIELRTAGRGN